MSKYAIIICCVLMGCSTVTPDPIVSHQPSPDASTPVEYANMGIFNSGFLGYVNGQGLITPNARDTYNILIGKYRLQFKEEYAILLVDDYGLQPYMSGYGTKIYLINKQSLSYFCILKQWSKAKRDGDTIWSQIKSKIVP